MAREPATNTSAFSTATNGSGIVGLDGFLGFETSEPGRGLLGMLGMCLCRKQSPTLAPITFCI